VIRQIIADAERQSGNTIDPVPPAATAQAVLTNAPSTVSVQAVQNSIPAPVAAQAVANSALVAAAALAPANIAPATVTVQAAPSNDPTPLVAEAVENCIPLVAQTTSAGDGMHLASGLSQSTADDHGQVSAIDATGANLAAIGGEVAVQASPTVKIAEEQRVEVLPVAAVAQTLSGELDGVWDEIRGVESVSTVVATSQGLSADDPVTAQSGLDLLSTYPMWARSPAQDMRKTFPVGAASAR